ncbi:MAG: polysaccharide biosynthesis/export family protein [Planctomycetaceae bacterium]
MLLLAVLLSAMGCAQGRMFTPHNLPAEWHARRTSNVKTVDLTRLASATVPNDEIAAGDVIEVAISAGLGTEATVETYRIGPQGAIELQNIGQLEVGGLKLPVAESMIKTALVNREIYRNPNVVVTMKERKEIEVTVVGAVEKEGTFHMRSGSAGVLNAIAYAEGFAEDAGTVVEVRLPGGREIESPYDEPAVADSMAGNDHALVEHRVPVRTSSPRNLKIDLASLNESEVRELDLEDGAVVMVERRDPQPLQVMGLVRKPDIYEYPLNKDLYVLDAIAMAGGEASLVADKVYVIRRRPNQQEPAVIKLSMRKAKRSGADNILLEPGDTVSVEQTPSTIILETIRTVGFGLSGRVF